MLPHKIDSIWLACGNSIRLMGAYAPSTKKIIFQNVGKYWQEILHVHLHNICAFVKFQEKTNIFMIYVKKRKFILCKTLFLELIFFTQSHDKSSFYETTLWACSMWRCTSKYRSICSMFQNITPWNTIALSFLIVFSAWNGDETSSRGRHLFCEDRWFSNELSIFLLKEKIGGLTV
jgi:hypothetical protein